MGLGNGMVIWNFWHVLKEILHFCWEWLELENFFGEIWKGMHHISNSVCCIFQYTYYSVHVGLYASYNPIDLEGYFSYLNEPLKPTLFESLYIKGNKTSA